MAGVLMSTAACAVPAEQEDATESVSGLASRFERDGQQAWFHDEGDSFGFFHTYDAFSACGGKRKIHVLLPRDYEASKDQYPVIYMNDGNTSFWRGGIGNRGGPGEAQIELDRRMIGERIKSIKKQLEKVKKQRSTQRRSRERNAAFRVSLVGYTNAGKSTLFNALVNAEAYAADQLFATLDTTTRQLHLEGVTRSVALSDTVGFIRELPHTLIEAFQATLREAADADLLLHVVDGASPEMAEQMAEVQRVLAQIGAGDVPQLVVFNKLDRLDETERPRSLSDAVELPDGPSVPRVFVSARTGEGLDGLRQAIAAAVEAPAHGSLNASASSSSPAIADDGMTEAGDDEGNERTGTYHSLA